MVNLLVPAFDIYIWRLFGVFLHLLRPTVMKETPTPAQEDECSDCSIKRGNFNVTATVSVSRKCLTCGETQFRHSCCGNSTPLEVRGGIISIVSGNCAAIVNLTKRCSKQEAELLLLFSSSPPLQQQCLAGGAGSLNKLSRIKINEANRNWYEMENRTTIRRVVVDPCRV